MTVNQLDSSQIQNLPSGSFGSLGSWTDITFSSGYYKATAYESSAQARVSTNGTIAAIELVVNTNNTKTFGQLIGTIPASCRPARNKVLMGCSGNSSGLSTATGASSVEILPNGEIRLRQWDATAIVIKTEYFLL